MLHFAPFTDSPSGPRSPFTALNLMASCLSEECDTNFMLRRGYYMVEFMAFISEW